jgi:hypothetical protein
MTGLPRRGKAIILSVAAAKFKEFASASILLGKVLVKYVPVYWWWDIDNINLELKKW